MCSILPVTNSILDDIYKDCFTKALVSLFQDCVNESSLHPSSVSNKFDSLVASFGLELRPTFVDGISGHTQFYLLQFPIIGFSQSCFFLRPFG